MDKAELLARYRQGQRVFAGTDLACEDLSDVCVPGASFVKADLRWTCLRGACLNGVDFQGARLAGADLRGADLTDAHNLHLFQLGGADLEEARVSGWREEPPELKVTSELGKSAQTAGITFLGACAYACLVLATTTDGALLANSASIALPVVGTQIPIVGFYVATPLLLMTLYLYLNVVLQRFWESLARLPAVFPDGTPVDQRLEHSLFLGLGRRYTPRLNTRDRWQPALVWAQALVGIVVAWVLLPLTLLAFAVRYMPRQDPTGMILHMILFVAALVGWLVCWMLAHGTLGSPPCGPVERQRWLSIGWRVALVGVVATVASTLVVGVLWADHPDYRKANECRMLGDEARKWRDRDQHCAKKVIPCMWGWVGFDPFATFVGADVSSRPATWRSDLKKTELEGIRGANLMCAALRSAQGYRAFLAGANLRKANLQRADLDRATLDGADLDRADLRHAALGQASLRHAKLPRANLRHANLEDANFEGADLRRADLREAILKDANFKGADFKRARMYQRVVNALMASGQMTVEQGAKVCTRQQPESCEESGEEAKPWVVGDAEACHVFLFGRQPAPDVVDDPSRR